VPVPLKPGPFKIELPGILLRRAWPIHQVPPEGRRYKTVFREQTQDETHTACELARTQRNETTLARRDLLQRAAWLFAAAALPRATEWAAEDVSPVMLKLSAYMSEARRLLRYPKKCCKQLRITSSTRSPP